MEHQTTCYTTGALDRLRTAWNKRHPDRLITGTSPGEIWQDLKAKLGAACRSEACWLRQNFARNKLPNDIVAYTFAPPQPSTWRTKPSTWLTSDDIIAVMKQAEHAHPNFGFFGPSPIDFDTRINFGQCVWNDICGFDAGTHIQKGINQFGFIFNTDPHYKGGEHWVALYVNGETGEITYMDSYGDEPPPEVNKLTSRIANQFSALGLPASVDSTGKRHQLGESECGMYCLFFIMSLLRADMRPSDFKEHRISDNDVRKLREVYFNKTV